MDKLENRSLRGPYAHDVTGQPFYEGDKVGARVGEKPPFIEEVFMVAVHLSLWVVFENLPVSLLLIF